ncbi:high choriolytic enzyme 2-like [Poecilia formosa]|uniref:high choriolytic enzyme 2-like n=1 Tax=Poecilia formosa TaxID=48698 RepID=UPI0007B99E65|nr:PREDICTED: high choriolytic enzyme 2-like [Poecilia formosa]
MAVMQEEHLLVGGLLPPSGLLGFPHAGALTKQAGLHLQRDRHALGFQHEQNRSDRDSYVRINWQNIIPDTAYNFNKHDTNNLNTPYDYSSIMHYGKDAFAIAYGLETITPISNARVQIG